MELTAIYHRPESEYAYLYKEDQLHIRIRTKINDVQKVILHYGDPFIFIEDKYEAKKEMTKVTSDALFDYWQITVSVDFYAFSISLNSLIKRVRVFLCR